ncbi:hypothetical protein C8J57DRAFT_1557643 [Mycena rebaudengoi]|nr:hypothetical protein C8J57DRAFT_1557643 [Mycena rebaudengoi]
MASKPLKLNSMNFFAWRANEQTSACYPLDFNPVLWHLVTISKLHQSEDPVRLLRAPLAHQLKGTSRILCASMALGELASATLATQYRFYAFPHASTAFGGAAPGYEHAYSPDPAAPTVCRACAVQGPSRALSRISHLSVDLPQPTRAPAPAPLRRRPRRGMGGLRSVGAPESSGCEGSNEAGDTAWAAKRTAMAPLPRHGGIGCTRARRGVESASRIARGGVKSYLIDVFPMRVVLLIVHHGGGTQLRQLMVSINIDTGLCTFPLLRDLTFGHNHYSATESSTMVFHGAPKLKSVILGVMIGGPRVVLPTTQLTSIKVVRIKPAAAADILRQATAVVEFTCTLWSDTTVPGAVPPLIHLESLVLRDGNWLPTTEKLLLDALAAPALRHLAVSERELGDDPISTIATFLSRSRCSHQSLHVAAATLPKTVYCAAFP